MECPRCGINVSEQQKFCHDCGAAIAQPDTEPIDIAQPDTEPIDIAQPDTEPIDIVQPDTEPIDIVQPDTEPVDVVITTEIIGLAPPTPASAMPTTTTTATAVPSITTPSVAAPAAATTTTAEMPAVFDGHDDLVEYPPAREPFRLRVIFLLALFGAAAVLMTLVADVIDLRTTRPAPGIATGVRTLEDLGSDLGLAGFIAAAVMVIGGLLACFGLRWGAGMAGGAGLALAGWAGLTIGLAELPIAIAESITRTSSIEFTLRVTRDLGWWLIVGVGVIGTIVFLASLRSIGSGGRPALNPLVAAVTAVATVVLAFGPLVPVDGAAFADNFRSIDPTRDLPAAFFAGRLGQVGLIALAGVAGMLIVRSYGVGLALGGITVPLWLWIASLGQIGANPVGIADRNPGANDTVPHAVTTVGMVATLVLLALAAALATYRLNRRRPS
jgi:hypothetical protein